MRFELENFHRDITNEELIDDLKSVNKILESKGRALSYRSYAEFGKFSSATFSLRFGSWNSALVAAGLQPKEEKNVSMDSLFENLRKVWIAKGKQPVSRDMVSPLSQYTASLYTSRFGSWRKALQEFVKYVQSDDWISKDATIDEESSTVSNVPKIKKRKTSRIISERMRFRILIRDGFTCQACGASPLRKHGVELHVDHIIPWSKGGETIESNLQTKCKRCNLGKGNAFNQ
jgi:hypothetical protein